MQHTHAADAHTSRHSKKTTALPYTGLGFDMTSVETKANTLEWQRATLCSVKKIVDSARQKQLKP